MGHKLDRRKFEATSHSFNVHKICSPPQTIRFFTKVYIIIIIIIVIIIIIIIIKEYKYVTQEIRLYDFCAHLLLSLLNLAGCHEY
jgi:hypothetical protein